MKPNQNQPADALRAVGPTGRSAAELRRRAEDRLKGQRTEDGGQRTELETARLVHELEVHQIELEMQNEELQQARANLEVLLAQYADLYDFAPTGYFTLAADGTIRAVNLTGVRLVGIERGRLLNRRFGSLVSEADRTAFDVFLAKTFAGENRECCEVALLTRVCHTPNAGSGDPAYNPAGADVGRVPPRGGGAALQSACGLAGLKAETAPRFVRLEAVVSEGGQECRAVVLDVTDHRQIEADRDQLIQDLQQALAKVKLLSGLLPICASCKKIRNDEGYWKQIESYIQSHSEATFTHSICPECLHKLYPELEDRLPEPVTSNQVSREP